MYAVSEENRSTYRDICQQLKRSPALFCCRENEFDLNVCEQFMQSNDDTFSEAKEENVNIQLSTKDLQNAQKIFIDAVLLSNDVETSIKCMQIDASLIFKSELTYISDDKLISLCIKAVALDYTLSALFRKLVILPKLNQLSVKLSSPANGRLLSYLETIGEETSIKEVLTPLLSYCITLKEQQQSFVCCYVEKCSSHYVVHLLRAMASRTDIDEQDLQIFQLLCEKCDPNSSESENESVTFLTTCSSKFANSVKYGRCLLLVIRKFTQNNRAALAPLVQMHSSSLKKAILAQL